MKKNHLLTLIIALAVAFTFSACNGGDDPFEGKPTQELTVLTSDNGDGTYVGGTVTINIDGKSVETFDTATADIEEGWTNINKPTPPKKTNFYYKKYQIPVGAEVTITSNIYNFGRQYNATFFDYCNNPSKVGHSKFLKLPDSFTMPNNTALIAVLYIPQY